VKILLDMNLSPAWVGFLVKEGFDAVHWTGVGVPNAPDVEVMRWAREHGHVLLTHDLDFGVLLALTRAVGPSVLQVRVAAPLPEVVGRDVVRVLRLRADAFEEGCLVSIDRVKSRVRVLPIKAGAADSESV